MKRPETLAILEAVLAITLWAVSFVFMKIALREISAATMIAIRFAMGAALVGLAAWRKGDFARLRRADMPRLARPSLHRRAGGARLARKTWAMADIRGCAGDGGRGRRLDRGRRGRAGSRPVRRAGEPARPALGGRVGGVYHPQQARRP